MNGTFHVCGAIGHWQPTSIQEFHVFTKIFSAKIVLSVFRLMMTSMGDGAMGHDDDE